MQHATRRFETPLGTYVLAARAEGLTHLQLQESSALAETQRGRPEDRATRRHLEAAALALEAYFAGEPDAFGGLTLAPSGTDFQKKVWEGLRRIPFGATESYGELARRIGSHGAARAVGSANRVNPLGIVVPCHRVVGARGKLTGYAGGIARKRWLLTHEGALRAEPEGGASPHDRGSIRCSAGERG